MSYLDLPRLHFSGLFFTGPSTINNIIQNFDPTVPLENQAGQFQQNAGWNALGVAQWWLEECTVLSAVGPNGAPVAGTDSVIGAAVQSPSPKTPMSDGQGGFYDIAKMVDWTRTSRDEVLSTVCASLSRCPTARGCKD